MDPDPKLNYGSGSKHANNFGSVRIRIHNPDTCICLCVYTHHILETQGGLHTALVRGHLIQRNVRKGERKIHDSSSHTCFIFQETGKRGQKLAQQLQYQQQLAATEVDKDGDIFTVASLQQMAGDTSQEARSVWELVVRPPVETFQAGDWAGLWLPESTMWKSSAARKDRAQLSLLPSPVPVFTVQQVTWPGPPLGCRNGGSERQPTEPPLPAFYRIETSQRGGGYGQLHRTALQPSSPLSPRPRKRSKRA